MKKKQKNIDLSLYFTLRVWCLFVSRFLVMITPSNNRLKTILLILKSDSFFFLLRDFLFLIELISLNESWCPLVWLRNSFYLDIYWLEKIIEWHSTVSVSEMKLIWRWDWKGICFFLLRERNRCWISYSNGCYSST